MTEFEKVKVDEKEKPIEEIILKSVSIFVDPFKEVDDFIEKERKEMEDDPKKEKKPTLTQQRSGVGSFVDLSQITSTSNEDDQPSGSSSSSVQMQTSKNKKTKSSSSFGNFTNW